MVLYKSSPLLVDFLRSSTSFWVGFSISTVLSLFIKQLYIIPLVSLTMDGEVEKLKLEDLEMQFQSKLLGHT